MSSRGVYIPPEVWAIKELSLAERVLVSEIATLSSDDRVCFASNAYFAELLGCSRESIKKYLSHLKRSGIIDISKEQTARTIEIKGYKYLPTEGKKLPSPRVKNYPRKGKNLPSTIYRDTSKSIEEGVTPKEKEVVLPFNSEEFTNTWQVWLQERKERKYKKYTTRGEQAALHNLQKISGNNEQQAIEIVGQSIAQGWQGLFPLKGGATAKPKLSYDKLSDYIKE